MKAGRAVIIGIREALASPAVMTRPTARNVSSGPPDGLARMVSRTDVVVKVMALAALLTWAPAGTWLPSAAA